MHHMPEDVLERYAQCPRLLRHEQHGTTAAHVAMCASCRSIVAYFEAYYLLLGKEGMPSLGNVRRVLNAQMAAGSELSLRPFEDRVPVGQARALPAVVLHAAALSSRQQMLTRARFVSDEAGVVVRLVQDLLYDRYVLYVSADSDEPLLGILVSFPEIALHFLTNARGAATFDLDEVARDTDWERLDVSVWWPVASITLTRPAAADDDLLAEGSIEGGKVRVTRDNQGVAWTTDLPVSRAAYVGAENRVHVIGFEEGTGRSAAEFLPGALFVQLYS